MLSFSPPDEVTKSIRVHVDRDAHRLAGVNGCDRRPVLGVQSPDTAVCLPGPADGDAPETQELIQQIRGNYSPNKVVLFKDMSDPDPLAELASWTKAHSMMDGKPTFYVCENFSCKRPTTNIKTVLNYLNE